MRAASLDNWQTSAQRWALFCWGVALVVVSGRVLATPYRHNVYPIFAAAAQRWVHGQGLYGQVAADLDVFRYSPLAAALFVPLASLPDRLANVLWRLINAGALVGACLWWARVVLPGGMSTRTRGLLLLLVLPLTVGSLSNGQCNPLVLALVLGAVAAARTKRWNLSAGGIALAVVLKGYPLAAGLLLAAVYPRRLAGRLAGALVVAALLPFVLQGPHYVAGQYAGWIVALRPAADATVPCDGRLRDLRLLCQAWQAPLPDGAYPVVQLVVGLGLAGLCVATRRLGGPEGRLLTLLTGLACGWMTALGPATESCTYVLVGPSLAAAVLEPGKSFVGRWIPRVSFGLLLLAQAACWFPWGQAVGNLGWQPLAALIFLGWLAAGALRDLWPRGDKDGAPPRGLPSPRLRWRLPQKGGVP